MQVAEVLEPGLYLPEAHIICGWVVVAVERRARVVQKQVSSSCFTNASQEHGELLRERTYWGKCSGCVPRIDPTKSDFGQTRVPLL